MKNFVLILLILGLFSTAYSKKTKEPIFTEIYTSIIPQMGIVKAIAGKFVRVNTMVERGHSPATYSPTPTQMKKLSKSKIFFSIGVPFELSWLSKIKTNNPKIKIVNMSENIKLRLMEAHSHGKDKHDDHEKHHHQDKKDHDDHKKEHKHGKYDPHIWLSPRNLVLMAINTYDSLCEVVKEKCEYFKTNLDNFVAKAYQLDYKISFKFRNISKKYVFVYHPAFGYLVDDYDIEQISIETEGKEPTVHSLKNRLKFFKQNKDQFVKTILIQPEFSQKSAKKIAKDLGIKTTQVAILGEDVFKNIQNVIDSILNN